MFEQTFVQTQAQTRRPWTVVVSLSLQCGVVAILFLVPLLRVEKLRMPDAPKLHVIPAWIPPVPAAQPKALPTTPALSAPVARSSRVYVPIPSIPTAKGRVDLPPIGEPEPSAWPGPTTSVIGPVLPQGTALPVQTPVAVVTPKPAPSGPVKVGGDVESAKLVFGPHPAYPTLAKTTHSQGTVRLEAIIAANGSIRNLRVISGPPLLIDAARDAVIQWRYQPTLLNGVAVEVLTEIEINFTLGK